ncbi:multidrug transporter subunit MdtD [Acerihabitans sp. TG2]|uniref:multidrug transporter subunit MdtD n=1 Tax=Acerihabitans sp. TG2 TaxID=3096008 RepID=UPI003A5989CE
MQTLDTTIVNTALPSMAHSLGTSPLHMHLVIVAYVLTVAIMLPASGWLADRFGVKHVFFSAIVLFSLGSLLCAQAETLQALVGSRVVQGIGGAMMVPVGRLTVMKIVPRSQYMAAMAFVTLPGQIGPLVGPALGGFLVEYVSWHWIFLINLPVGVVGALITWLLMPNYSMPTRRFDAWGFLLLATGMATLTLALDGSKGLNLAAPYIALLVLTGLLALFTYWRHARGNDRALFNLQLFNTPTFSIGLLGSLLGRIGSGMLPFMTPLFLQLGLGFTPFHSGLMMIPMVIGSMGTKRIIVQLVNRVGYRRVLTGATLGLAVISLTLPLVALAGWDYAIPVVLFFQGVVNAMRFTSMNTLTLKDLPDELASGGNSLLSMTMQLAMSLGVTTAGILLGLFVGAAGPLSGESMRALFIPTFICMALVIALPALVFARVPPDTNQNGLLTQRSPGGK